jgi:hypothetical protein
MVGICLVYAISGILLNHMNGKDPSYHIRKETIHLSENLSREKLEEAWNSQHNLPKLNKILTAGNGHYRLMLQGGMGLYDPLKGSVDYEISKKRPLIYWINQLHYNRVGGWSPMADIFAGSLIFFAISGLFMVPGKKGITGRGKYYLLLGLLIPVIYILLS